MLPRGYIAVHALGAVALGGERRNATVLFSDIRGLTSMSEQLEPAP